MATSIFFLPISHPFPTANATEKGDKQPENMDHLDVEDICSSFVKFSDRAVFDAGTPTITVVADILKQAADKNIHIAVTSSQQREMVIQYLSSSGLLNLFDAVVTTEDIKKVAPAPDLFLEAAKRIKCDPAKCIGLEYDANGLTAMNAAGMKTVDVKLLSGFPTYTDDTTPTVSGQPSKNKTSGVPLWTVVLVLLIALCLAFIKFEGNMARLVRRLTVHN